MTNVEGLDELYKHTYTCHNDMIRSETILKLFQSGSDRMACIDNDIIVLKHNANGRRPCLIGYHLF